MTYTFGLDTFGDRESMADGTPQSGLTHDQLMTTIELYGQQVIPRVRDLLG